MNRSGFTGLLLADWSSVLRRALRFSGLKLFVLFYGCRVESDLIYFRMWYFMLQGFKGPWLMFGIMLQ